VVMAVRAEEDAGDDGGEAVVREDTEKAPRAPSWPGDDDDCREAKGTPRVPPCTAPYRDDDEEEDGTDERAAGAAAAADSTSWLHQVVVEEEEEGAPCSWSWTGTPVSAPIDREDGAADDSVPGSCPRVEEEGVPLACTCLCCCCWWWRRMLDEWRWYKHRADVAAKKKQTN
jgi:hypothetical protein